MDKGTNSYERLTTRLGRPGSKYLQRALEVALIPEEAELLAQLPLVKETYITKYVRGAVPPRLPPSSEELANQLNRDEQWVNDTLHKLYLMSFVGHIPEGPVLNTEDQIMAGTVASVTQTPSPELCDAWKEYLNKEAIPEAAKRPPAPLRRFLSGPRFRILPHWRAIKNVRGALPFDDAKEVLKAQRKITRVNCPCRMIERNCDAPVDVCLQFSGRTLDNFLPRGQAVTITYDDALVVLDRMEEAGLVMGTKNTRFADDMIAICGHCACCCRVVLTDKAAGRKPYRNHAPSRFVAIVDEKLCDGCQACVATCHVDAIKMAQVPGAKQLKATVSAKDCIGCGVCVVKCPLEGALSMKVVRPPEFVPYGLG